MITGHAWNALVDVVLRTSIVVLAMLAAACGTSSGPDGDDSLSGSPTPLSQTATPHPATPPPATPPATPAATPPPGATPTASPTPTPWPDACLAIDLCCNGVDDDCDGAVDEEPPTDWFADRDGDGFGDPAETRNTAADGYVAARGDCDDTDPSIHPGAEDPAADGRDRDCGGKDTAQPHVGLSSTSRGSIRDALVAADPGDILWVGPGIYAEHDLRFGGDALTLISTHLAVQTGIDAGRQGRVFRFDAGEGPDSVLDGFTLFGGYIFGDGGGISVDGASPTLSSLVITGNIAEGTTSDGVYGGFGGGISLDASEASILGCRIEGNSALGDKHSEWEDPVTEITGGGGGLSLRLSDPTIEGSIIAGNSADPRGGGIYVGNSSTLILRDSTLEANTVRGKGGGLFVERAEARITSSRITGNLAYGGGGIAVIYGQLSIDASIVADNGLLSSSADGTGLYLNESRTRISGSALTGNVGASSGGAIFQSRGELFVTGSTFGGNHAFSCGGALYQDPDSVITLEYTVMSGNRAYCGGALYAASSPTIYQCTIAGNSALSGGGIYVKTETSPSINSAILAFNAGGNLIVELGSARVVHSDLYNPAGLSHNLATLDASNLEVDPRFVRLTLNGDPADDDLHLSPGSPLIDAGDPATQDPDGSLSDPGAFGGPEADIAYYADADTDGLYDGWESAHGLDPEVPSADEDPDGDGARNALELELCIDPRDPDTDGDGSPDGAEAAAGSSPADWYSRPDAALMAASIPEDFPTLQAAIDAVTTSGRIVLGPGTWRESLRIELRDVSIQGAGAGRTVLEGDGASVILATSSSLTIEDLTVTGGVATDGSGNTGGGISLNGSAARLRRLEISGNAGSSGAGLGLESSEVEVVDCDIHGNSGFYGVAVSLEFSSGRFVRTSLRDNVAEADNSRGGGLWLFRSDPRFEACRITGNRAAEGGAAAMVMADAVFDQCVMVNNSGQVAGGIYLEDPEDGVPRPWITNSIIAYNGSMNVYSNPDASASPMIRYSDLYAEPEVDNHNLGTLDPTTLTVEPGFLTYYREEPADLHLALTSPLIGVGAPDGVDPDGSALDPGVYGGAHGGSWDRDGDGWFDWFWPGTIDDAPEGFDPADFDCDDMDPALH